MEPKHPENSGNPRSRHKFGAVATAAAVFLLAACSVKATFPSSTITDSIQKICKDVYNLDVTARISGHTIGVLLSVKHLVDEAGGVDQELVKKTLGDLVLTVTRVALSTDHDVQFVVVVVRGGEDLNEIRITRNVVDIKKSQTDALSTEEAMSRTLWDQNKYQPDPADPGYFPLQDLNMEAFLARQVVQRARFAAPPKESEHFLPTELYDGRFLSSGKRTFEFSVVSFETSRPEVNVLKLLRIVVEVFKGYKFKEFDQVVIKDLLSRKMLVIDRDNFLKYANRKMKDEEVMGLGYSDDLGESDRLKNALEIFGFNFQ